MKTKFSNALNAYLAGPPVISQREFARRCGIPRSKFSRIVLGRGAVKSRTLDRILANVPPSARATLVSAYLRDILSPGALLNLKARQGEDPYEQLWEYAGPLSSEGLAALKSLMNSPHAPSVEMILRELVHMLGLATAPAPWTYEI